MIYLDYNATTPLAKEVLEEISSALERAWANPSSCHENGVSFYLCIFYFNLKKIIS